MKKLLLLASAVSAVALASGASAENASIQLNGTVPTVLSYSSASTNVGGNISDAALPTGNGRAVTLASFADGAGKITAFDATTTFVLNSNTKFNASVTSTGGLVNSNGLGSTVVYNIKLGTTTGTSAAVPAAESFGTNAGVASSVSVPVRYYYSAAGDAYPGNYTDTLAVSFTAAP